MYKHISFFFSCKTHSKSHEELQDFYKWDLSTDYVIASA